MPAPTPAQLGVVIRDLRKKRGLTIEVLAATAGIHTTYLSGIELGRRNPTWEVIGWLAEALEVGISEIALLAEGMAGSERGST